MSEEQEIKLNEVDVQKLNLKQGDVLMVTVKHEDVNQSSLEFLQKQLSKAFPTNQVMVFAMGEEGYVKFTVATQPQVSYNQRSNCDEMSYCTDCDCGKKERVEALKKEEK